MSLKVLVLTQNSPPLIRVIDNDISDTPLGTKLLQQLTNLTDSCCPKLVNVLNSNFCVVPDDHLITLFSRHQSILICIQCYAGLGIKTQMAEML